MPMSIPAIILLTLHGIALLISANKHGKPKTGKENFWVTLFSVLITLSILYLGGFFN